VLVRAIVVSLAFVGQGNTPLNSPFVKNASDDVELNDDEINFFLWYFWVVWHAGCDFPHYCLGSLFPTSW
jgi:hypothetical protein